VYLSISPDLYPSVAKSVAEHLRPSSPDTWLRVVFEKPFGRVRGWL
jgi:glucose-6-phosphate 1-dehydrogenase